MSSSIIFESDYPAPYLPQCSVFNYLFPEQGGPLPTFDSTLPAYIDGLDGRVLTRGDVEDRALRLASGLRNLGLRRGDVAALWGVNSLEWATAVFGSLAAGLAISPANVAYSPRELAHQINDSKAQIIFLDPSLLATFDEARPLLHRSFPTDRVVLLAKDGEVLAGPATGTSYAIVSDLFRERDQAERFDGAESNETTLLCYSSGTTGLPKGVETTHHNLTSELQALNSGSRQLVSGQDAVLGVLPFSHVYGFGMVFLQPLVRGVPVVVLPRFQEIPALEAIQKYKVTHALIVPPILIILVNSVNVRRYDLSSLRTVVSGAAPLGAELAEEFAKLIPGVIMMQAYGNTETSPVVSCAHAEEFAGRPGSVGTVGKLLPTYQARLVGDDGNDVGNGERGELWVRGPTVMKGYLGNPEATKKAIAPGGWYRTGDVCVRDSDGWYTIVDRVKELIKYKGFQVPPAELEALLLQHPDIIDAGVVGVYDRAQATELPRAYVVTRNTGEERSEAAAAKMSRDIQAWVAARVARHKRLVGGVVLVDAIPKSASGKILRKELRTRAEVELQSGSAFTSARL